MRPINGSFYSTQANYMGSFKQVQDMQEPFDPDFVILLQQTEEGEHYQFSECMAVTSPPTSCSAENEVSKCNRIDEQNIGEWHVQKYIRQLRTYQLKLLGLIDFDTVSRVVQESLKQPI